MKMHELEFTHYLGKVPHLIMIIRLSALFLPSENGLEVTNETFS